jgi:hypothetical protein
MTAAPSMASLNRLSAAGKSDRLIGRREHSAWPCDVTRGLHIGRHARPGRAVNEHVPQRRIRALVPGAHGDLGSDQPNGHGAEGAGMAVLVSAQVNDRQPVGACRRAPPGRPYESPGGYVIGISDHFDDRRRLLRAAPAEGHRHHRRNRRGWMTASGQERDREQCGDRGAMRHPGRHGCSLARSLVVALPPASRLRLGAARPAPPTIPGEGLPAEVARIADVRPFEVVNDSLTNRGRKGILYM